MCTVPVTRAKVGVGYPALPRPFLRHPEIPRILETLSGCHLPMSTHNSSLYPLNSPSANSWIYDIQSVWLWMRQDVEGRTEWCGRGGGEDQEGSGL